MMRPLKHLLDYSIRKAGIGRQVQAAVVVAAFDEAVKKYLPAAAHHRVKGLHYREHTLTIGCLSSVVAQEVKFNQQNIIDFVNERCGGPVVTTLQFLT